MNECCCEWKPEINTMCKCLPRALDMGHCFDGIDEWAEGQPIPSYCCKSKERAE